MRTLFSLSALALLLTFGACTGTTNQTTTAVNRTAVNNSVLTAEQQTALTPQIVIERLKQGNDDFVNDRLTVLNTPERIRASTNAQHPMAVILSCLDSRVPVEDVFHRGVGDLFVARVAGNLVNTDILGSMEFATAASGAKLVMVLGHDNCGAVNHAISNTELGNITEMLSKIRPAVELVKANFDGDASLQNPEFVRAVDIQNIAYQIQQIRENSAILRDMEQAGEIKIIGGYYCMYTGRVEFFESM